jgi:GT2 family glycosyltransferase
MGGLILAVDIIIVSYNTRRYLKACLHSIRRHTQGSYRVWVVDNGSTDGTQRLAPAFPWVRWILNRTNRGYGQACNQGAAAGTGDHIVFLNSDTEVTPNWLPPLVERAESDERIAIVGPKLLSPQGLVVGAGVIGTNAKPVIRGWMARDDPVRFGYPLDCLSLCGACLLLKRRHIPVLGLFDPAFFHYFEETDLCYRARAKGFRVVYEPASQIIHHISASCRDNNRLRQLYAKGQQIFTEKWREFLGDEQVYGEKPGDGFACVEHNAPANYEQKR